MKAKIKKTAIVISLLLIFFIFIFFLNKRGNNIKNIEPPEDISISNEKEKKLDDAANISNADKLKSTESQAKTIPDKILIDVPFTSQAPFAKWDEFHEESCEEASIIMVEYFLDKKDLTPQLAEKEIQDLIKFQIKKYGDYKDSTAEQTVKMFNDFYGQPKNGMNLRVIYDFEKEDLKKYLARGNPIIIPAAGRLLGNPNFTPPGPFYHNLVLIGYDGNHIITNDPGTRKGKEYKYDMNTLFRAIHDFPGKKENIEKGRKAMIILE